MTTGNNGRERPQYHAPSKSRLLRAVERKIDGLVAILKQAIPELSYEPDVLRLTQRPGDYELDATHNTGEEVLDVKFVPQDQVGAVPALHARWQNSGLTKSRLSDSALGRLKLAGFQIITDDEDEPHAYWREKQIQHAWICLSLSGWRWTRSKSVKSAHKWATASRIDEPRMPPLPGCNHTQRSALRESLVEALVVFEHVLPLKVVTDRNFIPTLSMLWEDSIQHIERMEETDTQQSVHLN